MKNFIFERIIDDISILLTTVEKITKGALSEKMVDGRRFYYSEWLDEQGNKFYQFGADCPYRNDPATPLINLINEHFNIDLTECEIFEKDRGARYIHNWAVAKKDIKLPERTGDIYHSASLDRLRSKFLMP
jgi:hypothetical protein